MKKYFWSTLKFSLPIIFSRSGAQLLTMLNVALIGHYGAKELAHFSIASSPYFTFLLVVLCLTSALPIAVAKNKASLIDLQKTFLTSFLHWLFLSISFIALCAALAFYFKNYTNNIELDLIFLILAVSAPWFVGSFILGSILEALGKAKIHALVTFMALPVNFAFSWLAMRYLGSALGTVESGILGMGATRFVMSLFLLFSLQRQKVFSLNWRDLNASSLTSSLRAFKKDVVFGSPIAFAYGLRSLGTTMLLLSLSKLGHQDVGSFSIATQILMLSTLISRGVASTSIIKVSEFLQKKLFSEIKNLILSSVTVGIFLVGLLSLILFSFSQTILGAFTNNSEIIYSLQLSLGLLTVLAVTDCASGVLTGALRPLGDTWIPQSVFGVSIILVAILVQWSPAMNLRDVFLYLVFTQTMALAVIVWRWRNQSSFSSP